MRERRRVGAGSNRRRRGPAVTDPPVESRRLAAFARTARRGGARTLEKAWTTLVREGVPIVEPVRGDRERLRVTFVWRPRAHLVAASIHSPVADFTRQENGLKPLARTGVWYRSFLLSRRTRASYGFSPRPFPSLNEGEKTWAGYFRSVRPDPANPDRIRFGERLMLSVLELPGAPRQSWLAARGATAWREERHEFRSRRLRNIRPVWVYLPAAFAPRTVRYNLLIVFDGPAYQDPIPTPRIVENLVSAGRLAPTVVVLVGNAPNARTKDLYHNPAFPDFLALELLPWLRRRFRVRPEPSRTVLAGSSFGGLAAAEAALRHPRVFGNVLAQSGSFLPLPIGGGNAPSSVMEQVAVMPRRPVRFYLDAGTLERSAMPGSEVSLLGSVHHLRDVLVAKGYRVEYAEFEGGHDYACWRGTLADGILRLVGRLPSV